MLLLQFRHSADDAEFHVVAELDLDHLGREAFADVVNILRSELQLSAAALYQMIEQEGREVLHLVIVCMLTEIQNLRHSVLVTTASRGLLIAELPVTRQCPKGRGSALTILHTSVHAPRSLAQPFTLLRVVKGGHGEGNLQEGTILREQIPSNRQGHRAPGPADSIPLEVFRERIRPLVGSGP